MLNEIQQRVDRIRRNRSELENHVIDEFFAGHISRREFVRAGSVVGLSLPLLSFIAACGGNAPSGGTSSSSSSRIPPFLPFRNLTFLGVPKGLCTLHPTIWPEHCMLRRSEVQYWSAGRPKW